MESRRPIPLRTEFLLARDSPFSYTCNACTSCCRGKLIPVSPYEVAHLAGMLGVSTTDVLAKYTTEGGAILTVRENGACIFLGDKGCTVHEGRPLACRLYPLGRRLTPRKVESFAEVVPHPDSAGTYGSGSTVGQWLSSQGAVPFIEANDRYGDVLRRMLRVLSAAGGAQEASTASDGDEENWLDMDAVVSARCAARRCAVPDDLAARTALHLEALEEIVARFE